MENISTKQSLDKLTFNRLTRLYMLALSAIAFSIIISHVIIDYQISNQKKDSYLINLSGRQRMLSQKIAKEAFLIQNEEDIDKRNQIVPFLKKTISIWKISHFILIENENSEKVQYLFEENKPNYQIIYESAFNIVKKMIGI